MKIQNYLADTFSLWIKNLVWYDEFCTRIIDKQKARIYIVMEFCEDGDLATVIKKIMRRGELIPEDTAWKVFSQVVEALEWSLSLSDSSAPFIKSFELQAILANCRNFSSK